MPDKKSYYIEVEGQDPIFVDEEQFNAGKDNFYKDYPNARVSELSTYKHGETALEPGDAVSINVEGQDPITLDSERFLKGADDFYRDYPNASVMHIRPVGTWGDDIRKQTSHQNAINNIVGEKEYSTTDEARAALENKRQTMQNLRSQLEDYGKKMTEEVGAIPTTQGRYVKEAEMMPKRKELERQLKEAENSYYTDPVYLGQNGMGKKSAEEGNTRLEELIAPVKERIEKDKKSHQYMPTLGGVGSVPVGVPDYEENLYVAGRNLNNEAIRLYDAPSKYKPKGGAWYNHENKSTGFNEFMKAAGERASEADLWTMGMSGMVDQLSLNGLFDKIRSEFGDMDNITDENIDEKLTPLEQEVLAAFFRNAKAQARRAEDLSNAYQAGRGAVDSLEFMAEFALSGAITGAIGKAALKVAPKKVQNFAKWIGKQLGEEAPASIGKGALQVVADAGKGVANTLFQPGTYKAIYEAMNQIDPETGKFVNQSKAAWNAVLDRGVEVFSESTGNYLGNFLGWGAGRLGGKKLLDKLANTEPGKWGRAFYNSDALKTLKAGGWNGYFGEMSEEFIGAALRSVTGLDPDAWKKQWDTDNIAVMALSFLPMSVIGGTVSTVKYGVARKNLADSQEQMPAILQNLGFNEDQIAHAMDLTQLSTPEKIRETIKPIVDEMATRGATKADQDALMDYAIAAATVNAYDGFESARVEQERKTAQDELTQVYGDFWHGKEGEETVERVTLPDGKSGYVQDTDETGLMTVKWDDGTTSFTSTENGAQVESVPLNQYLDARILTDKQVREAAQMQEDAAVARQQFNTLLSQNTSVPMGTPEAQEEGKILTQQDPNTGAVTPVRDADGNYTVVTMNGQTKMSENELAQKWGLNLQPKTDAQKEEDEVAQYEASKKRADAYNTIQPGTKVQAQLEGLDEPVEYEFTHAVYNEDTGEVEIKVWDAENEREETLPESAFPDLMQAASEIAQQNENTAQAEETEENQEAPAVPRDSKGKELPTRTAEDGTTRVDEQTLWNESPEEWVIYNDGKQERDVESRDKVEAAIQTVAAQTAETEALLRQETLGAMDQAKIDQYKKQIADNKALLSRYQNILDGINGREKAAAEAAEAERKAAEAAETAEQQAAAAEEERQRPLKERIQQWVARTGQKLEVYSSFDEIPENQTMARVKLRLGERVAGWYNPHTHKVVIYLPNVDSISEIDKTYMHEVISHKGLRELLWDKETKDQRFNELMDHTWNDIMSEEERDFYLKYVDYLRTSGATEEDLRRAAADEYIAHLAEDIDANPTAWAKFVAKVKEILERVLGMELKITEEDLKTLLQASLARYERIAKGGDEESLFRLSEKGIAANNDEVRFSIRYAPKEGEIDQIAEDISAQVGISKAAAKRWVESETSLAATISQKENQPYLDYTGDDRYTAIKENSDYPQGTVDFNNICRKRIAFTNMYQRIQKAFPNVIITGEDLANIRNIMKSNGIEVACGLCYVEDRRQLLGEIAKDFIDNYHGNFEEYASRGGEKKRKNAEKFRELIGEDRKDDLSIYDLITLDGSSQLYEEHPGIYEAFQAFNNARGQQTGNLFQGYAEYKREILNWTKAHVKKVNDNGGLRVFSYSDFEAHHLIDLVQIIQDCARMGVKIQGYTKVPAFARAVAETGIKLNRSLIPLGDTGMVDGKLAYDPVEGIDVNDPNFLESNDNIGNILIGINDEQIRLAMADPFVHYIIPYHSNQKEVLRSLKQTGAWTNYKDSQNEKDADGKRAKENVNIYTEVIAAAEKEGNPIENERQFTEKFLEVCRQKGLTPRFEQFLDRVGGRYVYTPGYYKLLVDFKMFDENGRYLPQNAVVAKFDDAFNQQILNDYVKGEQEKFGENLDGLYNQIVETLGLEDRTPDVEQPRTGDEILGEILESIGRNTEQPGEDSGIRFSIRGFNGVLAAEDIEAEDNLAVAEEMEKAGKDATTIWQATGWEKGADGRWRNEIPDGQNVGTDVKDTNKVSDLINAPDLFKSYPELENMPVEVKKLDVIATYYPDKKSIALDRRYNTRKYEGNTILTEDGYRSLLHELQHAIQRLEGFAHGSNKSSEEVRYYKEALKDKAIDAYFAWFFSRKNSSRRLNNAGLQGVIRGIESSDLSQWDESDRAELTTLLNHLKGLTSDEYRKLVTRAARFAREAKKAGERGYRNAVGEVEARNVEFRSRLSDKARRASPPSLTEDTSRRNQVIRFRVANEDQKIFISNAEKAVTDLKMDKATPEQWKKTLEKNGGLKAAEDKWLGLSTWLDGLDRKTVTKQEVLDYIAENQIQIEEQPYSENVDIVQEARNDIKNTIGHGKELEELQAEVDELVASEEYNSLFDDEEKDNWLLDQMRDRYGDDFGIGYFIDEEQKVVYNIGEWDYDEDEINESLKVRRSNSVRLGYTTEGLVNKAEIALTVPTIEPWGQGDKIHFGDAGGGRAVAWIRFGDTAISPAMDEAERVYREADKAYRDYRNEVVAKYTQDRQKAINAYNEFMHRFNDGHAPSQEEMAQLQELEQARNEAVTTMPNIKDLATPEENAKVKELYLESQNKYRDWKYGQHAREKVLVIDEIQSKRHQEAREQGGYKDDRLLSEAAKRRDAAKKEYDEYTASLLEKYGGFNGLHGNLTPEENAESQRLYNAFRDAENAVNRDGFDPMMDEEYRRLREEQQAHENSPEFKGLMDEWMRVIKERGEDMDEKLGEINAKLVPLQERNRELIAAMETRERALAEEFEASHKFNVPAAPFEKNWHELAMKRMLRYAAENGYDTVAWTTGEQQADRYSLDTVVDKVGVNPITKGEHKGERIVQLYLRNSDGDYKNLVVDESGVIVQGDYSGQKLSAVVGMDLATKIMGVEDGRQEFEGGDLKVGGEGMKGFYDDILPRFMNKYGKKWGVKVQDIFLPALGEDAAAGAQKGLTMHSVEITPEMKESVMEGQTMFRVAMDEEYQAAVDSGDMATAQQMVDEAAEAAGYTIRGYHGTTHNFTIFDQGKGNAEGNWGKGFYFTNNLDDAEANYANEDGPDLQVKIERLAENMEWMDGYEDMDFEERKAKAAEMLTGDDPHVISAAIRMSNPVVFNSRAVGPKETFFDFDSGYNPETDEYEGEESGLLLDFINAWNDVMMEPEWDSNNISPNEILDYADGDGIAASYLEDKAREILDNNGLMDYNGDLASGEFLRQVFERMGFDGIVDANVNIKFGTQRRYGRSMDGMDYGTTHFIAFQPNQIKQTDPVTYDDQGNVIPLSERFNEGNDDIRFRLAPNGKESNLTDEQHDLVRTPQFKKWFGDWEKAYRISKLRNSEKASITGNEIEASDDINQYKANARKYGNTLRGEYTNADTGKKVYLYGGNKGGLHEVLGHDYKNIPHLKSVAAIPQIIEKGIYIDSQPNEDKEKNPLIDTYEYYICGLTIGDEEYTVKAVVAVDSNGDKYYDHKLTAIEKGKLLDELANRSASGQTDLSSVGTRGDAVGSNPTAGGEESNESPLSVVKDKRLILLLQNNSSKVVDENGEPLVMYHGTRYGGFNTFDVGNEKWPRGAYFTRDKKVAEEYANYDDPEYDESELDRRVYPVFLNVKNPLMFDKDGRATIGDRQIDIREINDRQDGRAIIEAGYDGAVGAEGYGEMTVVFSANQIKSADSVTFNDNREAIPIENRFSTENPDIRFRVVEDPLKVAELEAKPKVKVYRSMQEIDGQLYPPMSARVEGKLRQPAELGVWEESEENPDLADENGNFKLDKGNGKSLKAAYAPYFHSRRSPLNEQFSEAYNRPNLVIVEGEIPESELTSGYTAEKSKKSVGEHDWPSGKVSNALAKKGQDTRKVILSRWFKPVRVVPNSEVADMIVERMGDSNISFPYNVVTPGLREELAKKGARFSGWQGNKPADVDEQIARMQAENEQTAGETRFRVAYHGSPADFSEFEEGHYREGVGSFHRPGFYFASDEKSARTYAYDRGNGAFLYEVELPDDNGSNYIHVFSSIPKSKRRELAEKIRQTFPEKDIDVEKRIVNKNILGEDLLGMFTNDELQQLGFVGIEGPMYLATMPQKQYVIFNAKDIKMKGKTNVATGEGIRFRTADDLVKRVQDYGLRGILDEDAAKAFWADAYAVMPEDARREIVDKTFGKDADKQAIDIRRYTRQYVADLAKKGYAEDESGLLRYLADKLAAEIGEPLDENTLRYLIWRSANRYASNNILDLAEDIAMRRRLGVGEFNGEKFPAGTSEAISEAEGRIDEAEGDREDARQATRRQARKTPYAALNSAMTAQRKYDQETVNTIVALAKDMIKKGNIDKVSAREMARLMTIIKDANGRKPATVKASALQLLDFMVDHTVSREKELLDKVLKVRTAKVREPGVDTIAKLDLRAQTVVNTFRDNYGRGEADIRQAISDLEDKLDDRRFNETSREEMRAEMEGLELALQYATDIAAKEEDIRRIRQQMKDAKSEFDDLSTEEKKQFRSALNQELEAGEEMIRAKKIEEVDAYRRLRGDISGAIDEGAERAKTFLEQERERIDDIHHWANADMEGVSADVRDRKLTGWAKFANSSFAKLFTAPLANLDQMLRTLGRRSPEGRGYLWNWMMGTVRRASDNEKLGLDAAEEKLNAKVREIFDEPDMDWNDLYKIERKLPKSKMRYFSANGEWVEEELTQGNLLYIYMVNKMTDGRMKLRQMNITDETVQDIKKALDPRFVELADWVQEEFLPGLRDRYNETHKRLFGTSMASIENYFPLRILGGVIEEKRNVGDQEQKQLPTDITGAIIKRTVNTKQLNLAGTDALSLVIEHVREMEHWNAYAEASRDFSTLLKYKRFQNQLKQLNTIYGAGKDLLNLFWDTVNLSVGAFRPTTTPTDKAFLNLAKGVTAAKISFRAYTAIKQILSWPAFLADANTFILAKNSLPTSWKKNWEWAMENLPNFKKRVESRKAGIDILEDIALDSKFWGTDAAKWINQNGMFMNAFVDALTVSIGARSMYETKKARYLKEGFTEEQADEKAKMDAEVLYNETQQSSEKEFMSTMQAHRTVANVALSAYRNSSMGYQRQLHQALRTLGRMSRKGYKSESIEFMTKQLEREGLSTADAEKAAINRYERAGWQALVRVAVFGWLVQFAWNLGSHAVYMLFGDDDDEKKNMLVEDATHALVGGAIEGLAAGNIMSEAFNMIKNGENLRNWDPTTLPIMSDIKNTISRMSSDPVAGANDLVYLAAQIGLGTNPQTISDAIVAIVDACNGNFETAREVMFCIMRILAVPQSQLDQLMIDEIGMTAKDARELSYEDVAKRYVDYKMSRNAPVTGPLYSEELREKREKAQQTTFKKKYNERQKLKEPKDE